MFLSAASAKALAVILVTNLYGPASPQRQLPFEVEEQGDLWLVKSVLYTKPAQRLRYCQIHAFFRKTTAEIVGFGEDGRQIINADQEKHWRSVMSSTDFKRVFGPAASFEPWTSESDITRILWIRENGGFLNKPAVAIGYAHVLMESANAPLGDIPATSLKAEEARGVWHIKLTRATLGIPATTEILSLSRDTGKLVSGSL